jgi:hypothetical protein
MYLHTGGHHHGRVMDPLVDLKDMKVEEIWEKDPTVPTEAALGRIAGGIHAVEVKLKHKRQLSVGQHGGHQGRWRSATGYGGRGGRMGRRYN